MQRFLNPVMAPYYMEVLFRIMLESSQIKPWLVAVGFLLHSLAAVNTYGKRLRVPYRLYNVIPSKHAYLIHEQV